MRNPQNEQPTVEEQRLLETLRQQQLVFESASTFLNELLQSRRPAVPLTSIALDDLQRWLSRIAAAQKNAGDARMVFGATGQQLTAAARGELSERELALRQFQTTVDQVLAELQSGRSELLPHLDTEVRRRSMHNAYQKSLKTR